MSNQSLTKQKKFNALWMAETIRLQEDQQGPLEDSEAVRQARLTEANLQARIILRAHWLAKKTNLVESQQALLLGMTWAVRVLCVCAILIGIGLVLPTFSTVDKTINVFSALGSLLGLNLLMLFIWLMSFLIGGESWGQLGKFWLWLSGKFAGKKQVVQLLPGLMGLLQPKHLERWWIGRLTNGLWLLILTVSLTSLLLLLATQRYSFIWQTTILNADTFISIVHVLGWLPSLLGFPIPDEALIRQSGDAFVMTDIARQTWAAWLIGVLIIYGLLPRVVLFLLCHIFWRLAVSRLKLDINLSGYTLLRPRLLPDSQIIGVTDGVPESWVEPTKLTAAWSKQGVVLVGIELDHDIPWPPLLPQGVINAGVLETREQRKQLLDQLTLQPAARLVIVCDPRRSVDRGTLSLITELAHCANKTKVCLFGSSNLSLDQERLEDWQQALKQLQISYGDEQILAWLGVDDE